MLDKLTNKFQQAINEAHSLAINRSHSLIEPIHLLSAMLDQSGGTARPILQKAGVNIDKLRSDVSQALDQLSVLQEGAEDP